VCKGDFSVTVPSGTISSVPTSATTSVTVNMSGKPGAGTAPARPPLSDKTTSPAEGARPTGGDSRGEDNSGKPLLHVDEWVWYFKAFIELMCIVTAATSFF
jgi:hypothetical protein